MKDMVSVRGHPFSEGTVWPAGDRHNKWAEEDDNTVRLFREAGAIILGTTVMTEFGVTPLGYSVHFKGPVNAYNGSYYCGGSSSGSAVAVALAWCLWQWVWMAVVQSGFLPQWRVQSAWLRPMAEYQTPAPTRSSAPWSKQAPSLQQHVMQHWHML